MAFFDNFIVMVSLIQITLTSLLIRLTQLRLWLVVWLLILDSLDDATTRKYFILNYCGILYKGSREFAGRAGTGLSGLWSGVT